MNILVSVICLTYNHEKYIKDALEGFVRQRTNFPFEVLVHDDASTDGTAGIVKKYASKYPHIIKPLYEEKNQYSQGANAIRTIIMPLIKGKYIAFCEGDDYWTDSLKLQKQVDFMESNQEYSLCCSLQKWFDESAQTFVNKDYHKGNCDVSVEDCILSKWHGMQTAGMLIRLEVGMDFPKWFQQSPVGDYPMVINAALHGKIRVLGEIMGVYRQHVPHSWTSRCKENLDFLINQTEGVIRSLKLLDLETKGKYKKVIDKKIEQLNVKIAGRKEITNND